MAVDREFISGGQHPALVANIGQFLFAEFLGRVLLLLEREFGLGFLLGLFLAVQGHFTNRALLCSADTIVTEVGPAAMSHHCQMLELNGDLKVYRRAHQRRSMMRLKILEL